MHERLAAFAVVSVLSLSVLLAARPIEAGAQAPSAAPISFDTEFINAAITRLRTAKTPESRLSAIENQQRLWIRRMQTSSDPRPPAQADVLNMYREIGTLAQAGGVKSEVLFKTAQPEARVMSSPSVIAKTLPNVRRPVRG
jgi:hypothetical protein